MEISKALTQLSPAAVSAMDRDPDKQPGLTKMQEAVVDKLGAALHGAEKAAAKMNGQAMNPSKRGAWNTLPELFRLTYRDMAGALLYNRAVLEGMLSDFHAEALAPQSAPSNEELDPAEFTPKGKKKPGKGEGTDTAL